jgi:NAD(P)H-hydrate epimerase
MERAAGRLFEWFTGRFDSAKPVFIFAGPGNNGGDGLAVARMLSEKGYKVAIFFCGKPDNTSDDWKINKQRLEAKTKVPFITISGIEQFPLFTPDSVIIDALFGSGLSRPLTGIFSQIIKKINESDCMVISVDMPSGLFGEDNRDNDLNAIIEADFTLSFHFQKLSYMFPENEKFTGQVHVLPIGLHNSIIESIETPYCLTDSDMVKPFLKKRNKFDHKGSFGHGLLVGGSYGNQSIGSGLS